MESYSFWLNAKVLEPQLCVGQTLTTPTLCQKLLQGHLSHLILTKARQELELLPCYRFKTESQRG